MKNYSNEIAEVQIQLDLVRAQRRELQLSNDVKVKEIFDNTFNISNEFDIIVSSQCACFFNKEDVKQLFTINFYERFREDARLELSYYTTSTQSEFELNRLISLGKIAQIIRSNSERIMIDIADIRSSDRERENELYAIELSYQRKLAEYRTAVFEDKKIQAELLLKGEGVQFEKEVFIDFKRNFTVRAVSLKIITTSKSNKTCIVQYGVLNRTDGSVRKLVEERVDVESLIHKVACNFENIVEALFPQ